MGRMAWYSIKSQAKDSIEDSNNSRMRENVITESECHISQK